MKPEIADKKLVTVPEARNEKKGVGFAVETQEQTEKQPEEQVRYKSKLSNFLVGTYVQCESVCLVNIALAQMGKVRC